MKLLKVIFLITLISLSNTEEVLSRYEEIQYLKSLESLQEKGIDEIKMGENLRGNIALTTIAAVVTVACTLYKIGTALFGYRKSEVLHDIPMERGFNEFDSRTLIHYIQDVPIGSLKRVKKVYKRILGITEADQENAELFEHLFENIEYEELGLWAKQDVFYKTNSDNGKVNYASILAGHQEKNGKDLASLFLVYTKGAFKLAPKLQMRVTTSGFGLASSKVKSEIKEIPESIRPEDLNSFFYFYNFISLKKMADYFHIKFEYPKIQIKKEK